MRVYEVFKHPERGCQAVKRGFCWPAFFFSWIWAFSQGLTMLGFILLLICIPILAVEREVWSTNPYFGWLVAVIYSVIVGLKANKLRTGHLLDHGWQYLGMMKARDSQEVKAKVAASGGLSADLKVLPQSGFFSLPPYCQRIFAMVALTWKAAFRYRLFWVLAFLLLGAVVGLPLLIKDDGTAEGFSQIILTYTLGAVTTILGICTLWLACGTLARDIEDCQMQVVAVKPIARWQIWLGKWLGLLTLNATLLAISGIGIFGLLEWRAKQLPQAEQYRLRNEVLVARASVKEKILGDVIDKESQRVFEERLKKNELRGVDLNAARAQIREQVKAALQVVPPGGLRPWVISLGSAAAALTNQPLFLRVKFNSSDANLNTSAFYAQWQVGDPGSTRIWQPEPMSLSADSYHEFPIPPNLFNDKGDLVIMFRNPNDIALLFPLEDGMEVLYKQGGFALNFVRGLCIILCWMTLFATIGLVAASFLSFPVAAFFSIAVLTIGLSTSTLTTVVSDGTIMGFNEESSTVGHSSVDIIVVPLFRWILDVINLVQRFSPIDYLSTGRCITGSDLALAIAQIVVLICGALAAFGIFVFNRRELATAQGTQ